MTNIAYLGLGIMGRGMAANLLKAGYPVTVWNRSPERCAAAGGPGRHVRPPRPPKRCRTPMSLCTA